MKVKFFLLVLPVFLIVVLASFLYLKLNKHNLTVIKVTKTQRKDSSLDKLIVAPQIPKNSVIVQSVTLATNGFLVVREIEEKLLSQIVEISTPLKLGTHKNVSISLGGADISGKDLIVMIYDDAGNDGIFNDFDMPALNANGYMTARYVSTGKPLPDSISEAENTGMNMPGMKSMTRIHYSDTGFSPNRVEVTVGSMVEFVNESSTDMWVASDPHPQHTTLPTFDQFRPFKKNGFYRYTFTKKGTWGYHDHLNAKHNGIITVN